MHVSSAVLTDVSMNVFHPKLLFLVKELNIFHSTLYLTEIFSGKEILCGCEDKEIIYKLKISFN